MRKAVASIVVLARGQAPFDAATVQRALQTVEQNARQVPSLFPPNSQQGETSALPAIWERKSDFDARAMKLAQDVNAAQTRITDQASLQAQLQAIGQNCGGCHEMYRRRPSQ
jgi:cytochrome c556